MEKQTEIPQINLDGFAPVDKQNPNLLNKDDMYHCAIAINNDTHIKKCHVRFTYDFNVIAKIEFHGVDVNNSTYTFIELDQANKTMKMIPVGWHRHYNNKYSIFVDSQNLTIYNEHKYPILLYNDDTTKIHIATELFNAIQTIRLSGTYDYCPMIMNINKSFGKFEYNKELTGIINTFTHVVQTQKPIFDKLQKSKLISCKCNCHKDSEIKDE